MTATTGLKAGVIGLGVGERHIYGYQAHERCSVAAICDTDPDKLAEVSARHPGIRATSNPADILEDPEIGVVSIASYDDAHHEQVMAALGAGKHVFVEKPLCLHQEELDDIAAALAARPQLKLSSNLILRRTPRFAALRERINSNEMGRLFYLEGDYDYGRLHKITSGWRSEIPFYSVIHGGGIHLVDLILWLTGKRVREVYATGNRIASEGTRFRHNDLAVMLLSFEDGTVAKVSANFGCVVPHFHRLNVYGTKATFTHGHLGAAYLNSRDPEAEMEVVDDPYPGAAKGDMLPAFVAHILDLTPPEVTAQEVLDVMSICLAAERSIAEGRPEVVRYSDLANAGEGDGRQ